MTAVGPSKPYTPSYVFQLLSDLFNIFIACLLCSERMKSCPCCLILLVGSANCARFDAHKSPVAQTRRHLKRWHFALVITQEMVAQSSLFPVFPLAWTQWICLLQCISVIIVLNGRSGRVSPGHGGWYRSVCEPDAWLLPFTATAKFIHRMSCHRAHGLGLVSWSVAAVSALLQPLPLHRTT